MRDNATDRIHFDTPTDLELEAAFDGGRLTSDGGLPWLAVVDGELGLCAALAALVPEWRKGPVEHGVESLVRQRVYQHPEGTRCGYEDQDDADSLRSDPLLKLVCGRLPETDADLASQPTMSRLENDTRGVPGRRARYEMAAALGEVYIRERGRLAPGGVPERILLDLDGTDATRERVPATATRRGRRTTATTASICTTRCSRSTATPTSSSPRCCGRATPTRAVGSSPY